MDLELERRVRKLLEERQNATLILEQLAESCTRATVLGGVNAEFALIGELKTDSAVCNSSRTKAQEQLNIRAESGESHWAPAAQGGLLERFWRRAIEQGRMVTDEADSPPQAKRPMWIVAIPMRGAEEIRGVLVVGESSHKPAAERLERLELRALLASEVLEKESRTERAAEQERWYGAVLDSSEAPVVLLDGHGFVRGLSRGARELLSQNWPAAKEIVSSGMRAAELFRPRDWERVQRWLENGWHQTEKAELVLEGELCNGTRVGVSRLPVGSQHFSALRFEPVKEPQSVRNVEEFEEKLRQSVEWLEEGVAVFEESGDILVHNSRFLEILGLSEKPGRVIRNLDDAIREAADNFAAPERFAEEWRTLAQNRMGGTHEELTIEKPMPQVIERCTRPIFAASGKKLGRVEVYREVTAKKMFQSRMLQAEKLASLGQRATAIMHELSNPLTTILGNAQRMVLREASPAQSAEAHRILEEAERATSILRQLLYLSREARPESRLISLNELAQHTVDLQRATPGGRSLLFQLEFANGLPLVSGDPAQLQQVLLNLLQNAQQAIEQSGQGTTIGVRTSAISPNRVKVEVRDDGPGVPSRIRARIFDPFFTTKPEGMGTGLGLAIVSGFVRQHGGSISVECPSEGGSSFIVELPAAEDIRKAGNPLSEQKRFGFPVSSASAAVYETAGGPGNPKVPHILVVEDEATVANLIADVLRDEGMRVDVLLDGPSALEAAQRSCYDLVICDLKMPEMDGQGFYGKLQQEQNPLREHILFVTGDAVAQRTHEFLERNRLPHLPKPFRVEELSEAVRQALWGGAGPASTGAKTAEQFGSATTP